jgi:hypothetical protein
MVMLRARIENASRDGRTAAQVVTLTAPPNGRSDADLCAHALVELHAACSSQARRLTGAPMRSR